MTPLEGSVPQAVVDAWTTYLAETRDPWEEYDRTCRAEAASRDALITAAEHVRAVAVHQAWLASQEVMTEAWRKYIDAIDPARRARDYAIEQATSQAALL